MAAAPDIPAYLLREFSQVKDKWYEFWKKGRLEADCWNVTRFPDKFPAYMRFLTLYNTRSIQQLPPFPRTLVYIYLTNSAITSLPPFHEGLLRVELINCPNLTALPPLPNSLQILIIRGAHLLTSIPALPNSLEGLELHDIPLQEVPAIPNRVRVLELCNMPRLTAFPKMPSKLNSIRIENIPIKTLPDLDKTNLYTLRCHGDAIECLPPLPDTLSLLNCSGTCISDIPWMPNLRYFYAENTRITDLDGFTGSAYDTMFPPCKLPPNVFESSLRNTGIKIIPYSIVRKIVRYYESPPGTRNFQTPPCQFEGCPLLLQRGEDESLESYMRRWEVWHLDRIARHRAQMRCAAIKEDLMKAVWKPGPRAEWLIEDAAAAEN